MWNNMYEGNTLYLYFLYKTKHSKQKQRKHKIFIDFAWKKANKKNLFFSHLVLKNKKRKVVLFYNGETFQTHKVRIAKSFFFLIKTTTIFSQEKHQRKLESFYKNTKHRTYESYEKVKNSKVHFTAVRVSNDMKQHRRNCWGNKNFRK